ncbi:MAG: DUF2087 domain-containing protein [Candidatus Eisenbacteria bacterium]|uniref:DUF2087 domain-containing protein n=1 Tax=Eiseniibacteriota bacterium TaxID=2212470 RepID=A0A7Y2EAB0_UNCEI|nr:DUF2087 domain-containing protein [Candidatus Eisenbacteria bacterium]
MTQNLYPFSPETSESAWRRLLRGGPLEHLPRKEVDLMLLLTHAAAQFAADRTYSETEVSEILKVWLAKFASPHGVDHVTVRRYLSDLGFLTRDPAGEVYQPDSEKLEAMLEPATRKVKPGFLLKEIEFDREQRRKQFQS